MKIALTKAREVFLEYGNDLDKVLVALDIRVIDEPLAGRLRELYFGDFIVLKVGLSEPERRELTAHALGHHFLHAGNHFAISNGAYSWDKYHERQAEVFAAYLLIPEIKSDEVVNLAKEFKVTEKFASFRLKLAESFEHRRAV